MLFLLVQLSTLVTTSCLTIGGTGICGRYLSCFYRPWVSVMRISVICAIVAAYVSIAVGHAQLKPDMFSHTADQMVMSELQA